MSNVKYKICSSGLEKVEANFIKVWVSKKKDIEFLEDDFILPSQCTHLVTKTNPELKKTEKILCALARGIPIIDYKHINKIIGTSNADAWNKEEYDIGGKCLENGQKLPNLALRQSRSKPGGKCLFSDWGEIAIFLPTMKASVYNRILQEGGARDVTLLSVPFQRKHLYSGINEVETIKFSYILSEPSMLESDQEFRLFVKSTQMANMNICSYYYVIEFLSKESPTNPQSFRLDLKSSYRLHKHQEKINRLRQSKLTHYLSKASKDKDAVNDSSKCESTPQKAELSVCLGYDKDIGFDSSDIAKRNGNANFKTPSTLKRLRQIEVIDLVDESPPHIREPTQQNKRFRDPEIIDIVDISSPNIGECTKLNKKVRAADEIDIDESRSQKGKNSIESKDNATTNAEGNASLLSKSTTKIKRCKSAIQNDIEMQEDMQLVTPIRQIKSAPLTPHTMKLRRLIRKIDFDQATTPEIFLDNNSCVRQCKKSSGPTESFMESPQTQIIAENSNSSTIGSKELIGATHYVKMQKMSALLNAWGWCDKDIRYFMGSPYKPCYESSKEDDMSWPCLQDDRECMNYDSFFETYTSGINRGFHTTTDELAELWLSIIQFLEDSLPFGQCPSITMHHSIFLQGVRTNANETVRIACFSYFERLILFQYPPHTPKAQEFYKSLLVRKPFASANELYNNTEIEMWHFLNELIEEIEGVFCGKENCKTKGSFLQLKLILLMLESDFASWIRCCCHDLKSNKSAPLLARILWPDSFGCTNKRVSKMINSYISTLFILSDTREKRGLASNPSLLSSLYRRMIGLIAQFIDICDKKKEQNYLKRELINLFMISLVKQESSNSNMLTATVIWSQLYYLKPDWLSAAIAKSIMTNIFKNICCNTQLSPKNDSHCYLYPLRTVVSQIEAARKIQTEKNSFNGSLSKRNDAITGISKSVEGCNTQLSSKEGTLLSSPKLEKQTLLKKRNGPNHSSMTDVNKRNQYGITTRKTRSMPGRLDLFALGGQDELTPLADAITSCQIEVAERLIGYTIETGNAHQIKALVGKKTKSGRNIYQLAKDTKNKSMIEVVEKLKVAIKTGDYKAFCQTTPTNSNPPLKEPQSHESCKRNPGEKSITSSIRLYWVVSSLYLYKYTALYRLHFTKLMMKNLEGLEKRCSISEGKKRGSLNGAGMEKGEMKFSDKREQERMGLLSEFSFSRSPDIIATDIRTFWTLSKQSPTSNPALSSVLLH